MAPQLSPVSATRSSFPPTWEALHLTLVSGKGGVGKTTLACGLARHWAQQFPQQQLLLLSTDPAHSLGDVLQMPVTAQAQAVPDRPNLQVQALDAKQLLGAFRDRYGAVLELLVERGSFVEGEDLTPVWDLNWPGVDELMGLLEIQRLLNQRVVDRIVVDMAPSGHTLNLFKLMDFLDTILSALELFQEKHRVISRSFTGRYTPDEADTFLHELKQDLAQGRAWLQDPQRTACLVVAIAEPMSLLETQRFVAALATLRIPLGGLLLNRILPLPPLAPSPTAWDTLPWEQRDRLSEQQQLLEQFTTIAPDKPVLTLPLLATEPIGALGLDTLMAQVERLSQVVRVPPPAVQWPDPIPPGLTDFIATGRKLILVGGKGGVGKTTVAAAIGLAMAQRHRDRRIRLISIDPAHSLGDAFGQTLGHEPRPIQLDALAGDAGPLHLSGQEVDAEQVLQQFREDYLWELAEMMSGEQAADSPLQLAYGPEAWKQIVSEALPGIDEMLSLVTVIDLLERGEQDLIILDTAPTGHLLRFLEMPTALSDWLAWIFKLWIKYQDVLGRTDLIGRLRGLRQQVVLTQKKLKDPQHTEFIGVVQAQAAIVTEAQRLTQSLAALGLHQHYLVHNRYTPGQVLTGDSLGDSPGETQRKPLAQDNPFAHLEIVRLPPLPRSVTPLERVQGAAHLLFAEFADSPTQT
ncbi:ArsA family ATPase [Trichothermofontia sichuanensis B231]|uniref:ArsA family ATPase n=1 Tax=Trichothermofontia sichuanensis TaxID=3045816 RepID=UPI0022461558|nr:ArsA family ATPase [Trichothermofontia sichuanensis]UZQ53680.1 ArsA family ATPase [Trichothermofontia sichuanensis B231]